MATLTIINKPVPINTQVNMNWSGFQPDAAITFTETGPNLNRVYNATSDSNGAGGIGWGVYSPVYVVGNTYQIVATDAYGHTATDSYQVIAAPARMTLYPSIAVIGYTRITANCHNFQPNAEITFTEIGPAGTFQHTATSDSVGWAYTSWEVPTTAGTYQVTAVDAYGNSASGSYLLYDYVPPVTTPPIIQSDKPVYDLGEVVILSGSGFTPYVTVFISVTHPDNQVASTSVQLSATGTFMVSYNCNPPEIGLFNIKAVDQVGLTATGTYIVGPNEAPILDPIGAKTVYIGQQLQFTVHGSDPHSTALTYKAEEVTTMALPTGAYFDPNTHVFSWTPTFGQAGVYNIRFTVTDTGGLSDSEVVPITVLDVNRGPILDPIGPKTVFEGQTLQFTVTGSDPDGGPLTFTADEV